jgi:CubicO group peptidase (beta-lactamase class C family)
MTHDKYFLIPSRVLLIALWPLLFGQGSWAQQEKVDNYVKSAMERNHIPGLALSVLRNGQTILSRCYGLSNVELSTPVTSNSVFKLASLTKPITAMAIMVLVEDGKVSLDAPVSNYLSKLPQRWAVVTIRQALSHTSGLADYLRAPRWSWSSSWRQDFTHETFIKFASEAPPDFEPGEGIRYSNTGYYLLGMVIEKVTGKSYAQFLTERIFQPLKMRMTRRDSSSEIVLNRVSGYEYEADALHNAEFTSDTWAYSEGGIVSTVEDLATWDAALYSEKLLKKSSIEQMWTPARLNNGKLAIIGDNGAGKPNYYGFGWFITEQNGRKILLHGGNKPGFTSTFTHFLHEHLTVIILSNNSYGTYPMSLAAADFFLN